MKALNKLDFEEISHDSQKYVIGGGKNKAVPITTQYHDVYSTCNNGPGSDTYEVYWWDGNVLQTVFYNN